ncbi:MAG: 50S ribosomal protein L23 [Bacteroidales bacterium]|nr:50S ribosomal protein L23 [Bacteroidales bacterium]
MEIIERPIVTEKFSALSSRTIHTGKKGNKKGRPDTRATKTLAQFAFVVNPNANKIQIKEAVESLYNVTVTAVNTMKYAGKVKSRMTKAGVIAGKTKTYKKAVVTLKEGDNIDFYSNI